MLAGGFGCRDFEHCSERLEVKGINRFRCCRGHSCAEIRI